MYPDSRDRCAMASREDLGGVTSGVDPRHSADKETSLCATFSLRPRAGSPCQPTLLNRVPVELNVCFFLVPSQGRQVDCPLLTQILGLMLSWGSSQPTPR